MKSIRAQGFAIDREEMEEGLKCIAAPVRNHTGSVWRRSASSALLFAFPIRKYRRSRTRDAIGG